MSTCNAAGQCGYSRRQARALAAAAVGLALCGGALAQPATTDQQTEQAIARAMDLSKAFEHVAEVASPAVVHIKATTAPERRPANPRARAGDPNDPFEPFRRMFPDQFPPQGGSPERSSTGSGVIVTRDGYILTNNHVVEEATNVEVSLGEDSRTAYTAKVIGTDPATDLAVLKIEGGDSFPYAELGDSDALRIGEWVLAIGNPFDLNRTVTAGIVSAKGRVQRQGQLANVQFQDFIQTDAAINPGNSGGPLLNLRGQVVGINSAILSRSGGSVGIGFSIPSVLAKSVMDQLVSNGKVERGFLGVGGMQAVTESLAKAYNFSGNGVLVNEVSEGGPAAQAGLKAEDIITKINSRPVANIDVLMNTVASLTPGKSVPVEVFRAGKTVTLDVTVGKRPVQTAVIQGDDADSAVSPADGGLGITVRTLDNDIRRQIGDRRAGGVVVTDVEPGSLAAKARFRPGVVIQRIGDTAIDSIGDFRTAMESVDLKSGVLMVVRINGVTQRLAVRDEK